jgi:hypothetical protein
MQNLLKSALTDFLDSGNDAALKNIIDIYPATVSSMSGDYPDMHRVMDLIVGNKCYRVCRIISQNEKLILVEINEIMDSPGVPLWLCGEKLLEWAFSEEENPSSDPVDWEYFR